MNKQVGHDVSKLGARDVLKRKHILIVEDSADVLCTLGELLNVLGYTFRGVRSAEDAMDLLSGTDIFDILLTDITLPGISGIELAKQTTLSMPAINVVFTSGYGVIPGDAVDFLFFCLPKPYTLAQLREILDKASCRLPTYGN